MDYGAHLPVISFDAQPWSLQRVLTYTETAERLGFKALGVNDHLLFPLPFLDSLTVMASVLPRTGRMALVASVALPVIRNPVTLAKSLAAIDLLSGGRLIVGVGPGSSTRDYAAVGIPFHERWKRFEEAVRVLRALLWRKGGVVRGQYYSTDGIQLEPHPLQEPGPPIWIGSWGSEAGLRRTARLGDGWLASAYNTTPKAFAEARRRLADYLRPAGKDVNQFPNAISTMYFYITTDRPSAEAVVRDLLSPALNRSAEELAQRLLFGPPSECAEKLAAYQAAGAQRMFLWPVLDEVNQLKLFMKRVAPLVPRDRSMPSGSG